MIETALVFNRQGHALYWHEPPGRTSGALPDSPQLWDVLWEYRNNLGGVAHTHPWDGPTSPSHTDITTFAAVEKGLGTRLIWPIVTITHVNYFSWYSNFSEYKEIQHVTFRDTTGWMQMIIELRRKSRGENHGG